MQSVTQSANQSVSQSVRSARGENLSTNGAVLHNCRDIVQIYSTASCNLPTADYLCGMCDLEKGFVDTCDAVIPCTV